MSDNPKHVITEETLSNIPIEISVILGKTTISLKELQEKVQGDFIALDHDDNDLVKIFANNKLIARGEVVVSDNSLGVTIKELV